MTGTGAASVMPRPGPPPLRRSSVRRRGLCLAAAWLWTGGVLLFYLDYHFAQPSSPLMVVGGHTYYTHPPALSLSQRDPVSAKIVAIALGLTLLAGTIDLTVRLFRSTTVPGVAAITAGGLCMLFSLFGLLWGLLGIGTAGLLVILSGLPMTRTGTPGRS